jgi:hypothetical protein
LIDALPAHHCRGLGDLDLQRPRIDALPIDDLQHLGQEIRLGELVG